MKSIFRIGYSGDPDDERLIQEAREGRLDALEELIRNHQVWIYNLTLRMVGNPDDAQDVTQEILIKIITKLSSFEERSTFRTWVYRIVVNHILSLRRRVWERIFFSFERQANLIESMQETESLHSRPVTADEQLLLEETKTGCMTGMLLCLERRERLVLILSVFFDADSRTGGEILETSPENYRQILSRARKRLGGFMNGHCGLMNESNSCRCEKKIAASIKAGLVDPAGLRFNRPYLQHIRDFIAEKTPVVEAAVSMKLQNILREAPMYSSPDFTRIIRVVLGRGDIGEIINFNQRNTQ